jgi:hypothetical protein
MIAPITTSIVSNERIEMERGTTDARFNGNGQFVGNNLGGGFPSFNGDSPNVAFSHFHPTLANVSGVFFSATDGQFSISDSTISTGYDFGAIGIMVSTDTGDVTIERTSISNFKEHGVRIEAFGDSNVTISDSTFFNNGELNGRKGGGLNINTFPSRGDANITIQNSTFSNNRGEVGAAMFIIPWTGTSLTLDHLTIVDNQADVANGGIALGTDFGRSLTLSNSLLAGNSDRDGLHDLAITTSIDVSHTFASFSRRVDFHAEGSIVGTSATGPLNPNIGPLAENGGPTPTHKLYPLSPALNAGDPNFASPPKTDQRGLDRVVGGRLDMGAVEFQARGDFQSDGVVNCEDVDRLVQEIVTGNNTAEFDLNEDGLVDNADLNEWVVNIYGTLSGDANLDGVVDVSDFGIWNASKFTATSGWCSGDFNADGLADVSDFNLWNTNKFQSAFSSAGSALSQVRPQESSSEVQDVNEVAANGTALTYPNSRAFRGLQSDPLRKQSNAERARLSPFIVDVIFDQSAWGLADSFGVPNYSSLLL